MQTRNEHIAIEHISTPYAAVHLVNDEFTGRRCDIIVQMTNSYCADTTMNPLFAPHVFVVLTAMVVAVNAPAVHRAEDKPADDDVMVCYGVFYLLEIKKIVSLHLVPLHVRTKHQ
jgi:hypothetical protein